LAVPALTSVSALAALDLFLEESVEDDVFPEGYSFHRAMHSLLMSVRGYIVSTGAGTA